jgi:hypothetical protein
MVFVALYSYDERRSALRTSLLKFFAALSNCAKLKSGIKGAANLFLIELLGTPQGWRPYARIADGPEPLISDNPPDF